MALVKNFFKRQARNSKKLNGMNTIGRNLDSARIKICINPLKVL